MCIMEQIDVDWFEPIPCDEDCGNNANCIHCECCEGHCYCEEDEEEDK